MRVIKLVFELQALKAKLKGSFTGHSVTMVSYYAIKISFIGSPMAGHLPDTNFVVPLDKESENSHVNV